MIVMTNLNLPAFQYQIQKKGSKFFIFDIIRKKYISLTPEEWVRQHFLHFLVSKNYPKSLISVESYLKYNHLSKRSDIVVSTSQGVPLLLVECKSAEIALHESHIHQVLMYRKVLKTAFFCITNGIVHRCFQVINEEITELAELPDYATAIAAV
jgi:hypothetical protein